MDKGISSLESPPDCVKESSGAESASPSDVRLSKPVSHTNAKESTKLKPPRTASVAGSPQGKYTHTSNKKEKKRKDKSMCMERTPEALSLRGSSYVKVLHCWRV